MSRIIGNVGMLDLTEATVESVKSIERIDNVGMVLYRAETAHLLALLTNAGNIGKTLEIPRGYRFFKGTLKLNAEYFKHKQPENVFTYGTVVIDRDVTLEAFEHSGLHMAVRGEVYVPKHLEGAVTASLLKMEGAEASIQAYQSELRFESGKFRLTNAYLSSLKEPRYLVVNGVLELEKDLDMEQFAARLETIHVNGIAMIHEEQSLYFYDKMQSINGQVKVIPAGFEHVTKTLRLNARTIRRFADRKIYTKHPIVLDADVSREAFSRAITGIQSTSMVICSEDIEDLVWERCPDVNTEIVSYEQAFVFVEGEEVWSKDQLLALKEPVSFIVDGTLILEDDVTEDVLEAKLRSLDLFGKVMIAEKRIKGVLYPYLRSMSGSIIVKGTEEKFAGIGNVGMLSL